MIEEDASLDVREVAAALRLVSARLNRRLRQSTDVPISPSALSTLSSLVNRGPLTLGQLAEMERVRPPTMTSMVSGLESRALVSRLKDPNDRRLIWLKATAEGERLIRSSRTQKNLYLARLLASLSPAELIATRLAASALGRLLEDED